MNICIFDTETTSLEKPFCYNIGYVIADTESHAILVKKDFVVEQVWHNDMLFTTAYYADKRSLYINSMRSRKTAMEKFGYICQEMIRDFHNFNINYAYAYNCSFDEKVFNFNCDWFKCNNPFDNIEILDIRAFAIRDFVNDKYKEFCDKYGYYTDSKNYSTTAEVMYRYIKKNTEFIEDHTALSDSLIETEILFNCSSDITIEPSVPRSIVRKNLENWKIKKNKQVVAEFDCYGIMVSKSNNTITIKT